MNWFMIILQTTHLTLHNRHTFPLQIQVKLQLFTQRIATQL